MNSVRIVADSGCDLTPELVSRYEVTVVPCFLRFGQDMVPSDTAGCGGVLATDRECSTKCRERLLRLPAVFNGLSPA